MIRVTDVCIHLGIAKRTFQEMLRNHRIDRHIFYYLERPFTFISLDDFETIRRRRSKLAATVSKYKCSPNYGLKRGEQAAPKHVERERQMIAKKLAEIRTKRQSSGDPLLSSPKGRIYVKHTCAELVVERTRYPALEDMLIFRPKTDTIADGICRILKEERNGVRKRVVETILTALEHQWGEGTYEAFDSVRKGLQNEIWSRLTYAERDGWMRYDYCVIQVSEITKRKAARLPSRPRPKARLKQKPPPKKIPSAYDLPAVA